MLLWIRVSDSMKDLCLLKGKDSSNFSILAFLGDSAHSAFHSSFNRFLKCVLAAFALRGRGDLSR